jgi:hypothetical protein
MAVEGSLYAGESSPGQGFASPQAAYEAMDRAMKTKDWRGAFRCITPGSQEAAVWANYQDWIFVEENAEVRALLNKYGVGIDVVLKQYGEEKERTIQTGKASVSTNRDPKISSDHEPLDFELWRKIVLRRLSDKAGFFSDTRDLTLKRGGEFPQFGPLYDIRVAGDAATGLTTMTTSFEKSDETGIKKVYTTDVKTHHFRRLNGRWFVGD